jgi:hypothetical protein
VEAPVVTVKATEERMPGYPKKVEDPAVTVEATEKRKFGRSKKLAA